MEYTKLKELSDKLKNSGRAGDAVLSEIADQIWEYTKGRMQTIQEMICAQDFKGTFGVITTAFSDQTQKAQLEEAGFYGYDRPKGLSYFPQSGTEFGFLKNMNEKIAQCKKSGEKKLQAGYAFVYCSYRVFQQLTETYDNYKGCFLCADGRKVTFRYKLLFSDQLLKKEHVIKTCIQLYRLHTPDVFSPMARRLVEVCIDLQDCVDEIGYVTGVDLQLDQNHLQEIFAAEKRLMWNVKQQVQDLDMVRTSPLGEENHFVYLFEGCSSNQYIIPLTGVQNCLETRRENDRVILVFRNEYDGSFMKLTIWQIHALPRHAEYFTNRHAENDIGFQAGERLERLRSEADIRYAASLHGRQLGMELKEISNKPLQGYTEYVRYRKTIAGTNLEKISQRSAKSVYLYYENPSQSIFADDYLNYICGYFNWMYPDIQWRGGYR